VITDRITIKTEVVFSDDRQHRYLLRKEWDSKKPKATVIMTNPSTADILTTDYTTMYIMNNLTKLGFGSVDIVNLISKPTTKLRVKDDVDSLNEENILHIVKSAERSEFVIIAWGKLGENNKKVRAIQDELLHRLRASKNKLYIIASENGDTGFHPLAPQIRFTWILKEFQLPERPKTKEEAVNDAASAQEK